MTRIERGPDDLLVISCKSPRKVTDIIEKVVRERPSAFKSKSDFVRRAILHLLRDLGAIEGDRMRRLRVDAQSNGKSPKNIIENTFNAGEGER